MSAPGAGVATIGSRVKRVEAIVSAIAVAAAASSAIGCSLLLDWTGYTGEIIDSGKPAPMADSSYLLTCGRDLVCAPAPPAGWNGPVTFGEVGSDAAAPSCANSYSPLFQGKSGLVFPPASCSCSCEDPTGGCAMPSVSYFSDLACNTACGTPTTLGTSCTAPTPPCVAFQIGSSSPSGAACAVADAATTLPPFSWTRQSVECIPVERPQQGSCSANEFCLPAAPPGLSFCVSQAGTAGSCPPGSVYTRGPYLEYSSAAMTREGRACSPCGCAPPTGASCSQASAFITDVKCNIPGGVPFFAPSNCLANMTAAKTVTMAVTSGGQCASTGGTPGGSVTPIDPPTSFCCTP